MSEKAHYARTFLNTEEYGGLAAVEATIDPVDSRGNFGATLRISDCNRTVELDFDCYGSEQVAERRQKITRLRRAVVAFEKVLLAQLEDAENVHD